MVEDLTIDEIKQLVNFYRQKANDAEFQLLQSQLRMNRLIIQQKPKEEEKPTKAQK